MTSSDYQAFKIWLEQVLPVERDILHAVFGVGVLVLVLILARRRLGALRAAALAFAIALPAALTMEALDRHDSLARGVSWDRRESLSDVGLTTGAPLAALLVLGLRRRRARQVQ